MECVAVLILMQCPYNTIGEINGVAIFGNVSVDAMVNDVGLSASSKGDRQCTGSKPFDECAREGFIKR